MIFISGTHVPEIGVPENFQEHVDEHVDEQGTHHVLASTPWN